MSSGVQNPVKSISEWGAWKSDDFAFTCKHVKHYGNIGSVFFSMKRLISETTVRMPSFRNRLESLLTAAERTEYQSAIGSLQCLPGSARLDLAADTSLCQGLEPKVNTEQYSSSSTPVIAQEPQRRDDEAVALNAEGAGAGRGEATTPALAAYSAAAHEDKSRTQIHRRSQKAKEKLGSAKFLFVLPLLAFCHNSLSANLLCVVTCMMHPCMSPPLLSSGMGVAASRPRGKGEARSCLRNSRAMP